MPIEVGELRTERGDTVMLTLIGDPDGPGAPTILVTIHDADESELPTAELTLNEAGQLREELRRLGELARGGRP